MESTQLENRDFLFWSDEEIILNYLIKIMDNCAHEVSIQRLSWLMVEKEVSKMEKS